MPSSISPNMSLIIPTVGQESGPQWASDINASLSLIDAHDHSLGNGVQVTPSGLNINADLPIGDNNLTGIRSARLQQQSAALALASDLGCLYRVGVDLYFNDGNGNQIRITQSGGIAGSPGSIANLTSPASASYVSANSTFVWQSDTLTPANMDLAGLVLRNLVASSKGLTLSPPNSMSADFALTLPSLPASKKIMTLAASGNIAGEYDVDNSTIEISANNLQVKNAGITQAKMAIRTTGSTVAAGGVAISSSCGTFSTASNTPVDVTNLSVTITTLGNPVQICLIPATDGSVARFESAYTSPSNQIFAEVSLVRDSTTIAVQDLTFTSAGAALVIADIPVSAVSTMDFPAAGTYTYKVQLTGATSRLASIVNAQLVAYEIK